MELNICHLYPDLLNVYGDVGNILILKDRIQKRNIDVNIHNISVNDKFDADMFDIVLLGGGQDTEQTIASNDLKYKKDELKRYIETDKVLLTICGGYQLIGEYYIDARGNKIDGLSLIDVKTEKGDKRFIGNTISKEIETSDYLIGFENHSGRTILGERVKPMAKVLLGFGNNGEDQTCGAVYKNTYGTYLHGCFLSKNPHFADKLIKKSLEKKYGTEIELERIDDEFYNKARNVFLNKFLEQK